MFAVVQIAGSQYKVSEGDTIDADRIKQEVGSTITFEQVLVYSNDGDTRIGQPYLGNVKVSAKVINRTAGKKVRTLKYRATKDSATRTGQRRKLTTLNITKISA